MRISITSIMSKSSQIVKPPRMWIDGKIYNIQPKGKTADEDACSPEHSVDYNITQNNDRKLFTSFQLPAMYYIRINNHRNFNLKDLETETSTTISVPKCGKEGHITITGTEHINIAKVRHRIHSIASEIRDSCSAMQFISIPVLSDEIKANFEKFKSEILSGGPLNGLHESIFQSKLKLHLTIAVFALMDKEEKTVAVEALNEYKSGVLDPLVSGVGTLKIRVAGIDCMNSNYEKVHVLYAKAELVDESGDVTLQKIADGLFEHFYERGLVRRYEESIRLHVTLMNTKYRKPENSGETPQKRKKWVKRESFDARPIFEKYKNYTFGVCDFEAIHLSLISSKGEDGFYKPISIIKVK